MNSKRYCVMVLIKDGTWKPSLRSSQVGGFVDRKYAQREVQDLRRIHSERWRRSPSWNLPALPAAIVSFVTNHEM